MSSHQLDNSGLNRTSSTWNLQPFKDFAIASWHRWNVQPLGVKAIVGLGSAAVLGIICIIVRRAFSSSNVTPNTSASDKTANGASEGKGSSGSHSTSAANPPRSDGTSAAAKDSGVPPSKPAASARTSEEKGAKPVTSVTATAPKEGQKEPEKTKWVNVLSNQVSEVPFRSLSGQCMNEQYDPKFPPYAQGVYCFKPQAILRNKNISNDKKIEVIFSYNGVVFHSESVSGEVEKCAIFLRNLPYERDVRMQFTVDGKDILMDTFNVNQKRGAYMLSRASQKLQEHEFPNPAVPGRFIGPNFQGGVPGWNIDTSVGFILEGTSIRKSDPQPGKGHYYLDNQTDFVQVVIFELGIQVDRASPVDSFVSFSVAVLPKSDKSISKESLIESVRKAAKKGLPAGAEIGVSNIQQIVYSNAI